MKGKLRVRKEKNVQIYQKINAEMTAEFLALHPELASKSAAELHELQAKHDESEERMRRRKLRDHVMAFYDGVVAVIVTIMLLEIPLPSASVSYLTFVQSVGVFLISFFIIAEIWFENHRSSGEREEFSNAFAVLIFIFTAVLSLVPLLTKWLIVNPTRFVILNYGVVLLILVILGNFLTYYTYRERFKRMPRTLSYITRVIWGRSIWNIIVTLAVTTIAMLWPIWGHWFFMIFPIFSFVMYAFRDEQQRIFTPDLTINGDKEGQ